MCFGKEVRVILKGEAKEAYLALQKRTDKESKSILNSIERIKNILKENPQYGGPNCKNSYSKEFDFFRN